MTMHKILSMSLLGCVLALGACDKGGDKKADKQAAKGDSKAPAKAEGGDAGEGDDAQAEEDALPPLDPKVEQAVTLANQISADPSQADSILEAAGMDRGAFEALLYEIAKDPELSKSYAIAREA